ncbi:hypothetical protein QPK06_20255 [Aeromonas veronii]|uniref:hypothetical protein n=1 Tax=Aeromonas veronii TaxID=654 RepID=UPI0025426D39|nr:hypothetical protein [Aeromonas veronii]WIJ41348.1 hypothetical protein QPK06_20255 [Aeromonas veronii]
MTVQELEETIWEIENIRVIIRAAEGQQVGNYGYQNAANQNWNVKKFLDDRVRPLVPGLEVIVIQGNGEEPHSRTLLRNVRPTYAQ